MNAKTETTIKVPASEAALFAQIGAGFDLTGRATHHWAKIVAPGLIKVYRTRETAEAAKDRMVDRAILPKAPAIYSGALAYDLPKKSSKIGQTAFDLNCKGWKVSQVPKWLGDHIEGMGPNDLIKKQYSKKDVIKMIRTYDGFFELITEIKKDARAHCSTTFGRLLDHAWPKPKAEAKPKADKPEGDAKPEDSKLNPTQTLVSLINTARTYAQGKDGLPSQPAVIAHLTKAIELLGS
jgi:hypothetical protein